MLQQGNYTYNHNKVNEIGFLLSYQGPELPDKYKKQNI